jgi:hypothetical protein
MKCLTGAELTVILWPASAAPANPAERARSPILATRAQDALQKFMFEVIALADSKVLRDQKKLLDG